MRDRGSVVIVEVNVKECIATVYFNGIQYCFLSETINGTFGTGQGQEYTDKDIYRDSFASLDRYKKISSLDVIPKEVALKVQSLFK